MQALRPWILSLLTVVGSATFASEAPRLDHVAPTVPISVDGELAPEEWPESARLTGFLDTADRSPWPVPVEIWLLADEQAIYFAARITQDPSLVRNEQTRQNAGFRNDDTIRLSIDAQGLGTGFDSFTMNASTGRSVNLEGGRAPKLEWLGSFESQGRKTDTGWVVEARVPWILVTRRQPGNRTLKFTVNHQSSSLRRSGALFFDRADSRNRARWTNVPVPAIRETTTVKFLPYVTASASNGLAPGLDSGIDFKTQLNSGQAVVGTINPDFRNIENSILGLDFSYFERLGDENRPFFAEGDDYFRAGELFASQRLQRIDSGLKFYGQLNPRLGLGVMNLAHWGVENTTVVTLSGSTPDRLSFAASTVNYEREGRRNRAVRLTASQDLGNFGVSARYATAEDQQRGQGYSMGGNIEYDVPNFEIGLNFQEVSPDFFPRVGFVRERNARSYSLNASSSRQFTRGALRSVYTYANVFESRRLDGDRYRGGVSAGTGASLRNGLSINVNAGESYFEQFNDRSLGVSLFYPDNDPFRNARVSYSEGRVGGRDFTEFGAGYEFRPFRNLYGSVSYSRFTRGDTEEQVFGRLSYDLNDFEAISLRVVNDRGAWNWFATYRLTGRKGPEYFLIFGDPRSETFRTRVAFKMTVPFQIEF